MSTPVEPEVLVNCILGKVSDVLINGDGTVLPKSADHYLAFMSPGIPMLFDDFKYALEGFGGILRKNATPDDPVKSTGPQDGPPPEEVAQALAEDAQQKYARAESFSAMCDLIPDTSGIVESGRINIWNPEHRVSHVYGMALKFSQVYNVEPNAETKRNIERWRSLLQKRVKKVNAVSGAEEEIVTESPLVQEYNQKMDAWMGAALEYNELRISALAGRDQEAVHRFAINGSIIQNRVRARLNDWITNGYKDDYEGIAGAMNAIGERSMPLLKQSYKEDFARSIVTSPNSGANFCYTAPTPASFAQSGAGWSRFYFNSGSFHSNHTFTRRSTSGVGGFSIGIVSFGGGGGTSMHKWQGHIDAETFRLEFWMCRVPIYRPWFNLAFLKSGWWRFDQNNVDVKNCMLSDGGQPPNGLMPAITTECIFIKDLVLDFGSSNTDYFRQQESVSGAAGIAIGPFWGGGRHSNESDNRTFDAEWTRQGLRVPGLQLLGFICHTLPKSPDPNPQIREWI